MAVVNRNSGSGRWIPPQFSLWVLLLTNLLFFQLGYNGRSNDIEDLVSSFSTMNALESTHAAVTEASSSDASASSNPLAIPEAPVQNLPSVRVDDGAATKRDQYGGEGDKVHLGGFTSMDIHGISPAAWKWMVQSMNIHSVMDVGCGRGLSTSWFIMHGLDTLCVEGSHDAREKTVLPDPDTQMVEHDFSRGPWWPAKTYDAVWCVEFLEHVGVNFHKNYLPAFRKAGVIFATRSSWGGWHHVEVHEEKWWITKMEMYGFKFDSTLTEAIRNQARGEKNQYKVPNGQLANAQHVWLNMMVFINPVVAAKPEHHHIFHQTGCYSHRKDGAIQNRECATGMNKDQESPLPNEYKPLTITEEQDQQWFEWIKARVPQEAQSK